MPSNIINIVKAADLFLPWVDHKLLGLFRADASDVVMMSLFILLHDRMLLMQANPIYNWLSTIFSDSLICLKILGKSAFG